MHRAAQTCALRQQHCLRLWTLGKRDGQGFFIFGLNIFVLWLWGFPNLYLSSAHAVFAIFTSVMSLGLVPICEHCFSSIAHIVCLVFQLLSTSSQIMGYKLWWLYAVSWFKKECLWRPGERVSGNKIQVWYCLGIQVSGASSEASVRYRKLD